MHEKQEKNKLAFEYAREILTGVVAGVMSVVDDILHPIDNVIYPISMLAYDALIISAGHQGSLPVAHPLLPDLSMAQAAIQQNPALFHEAVDRMHQRGANIRQMAQGVVDANGPQRAGMIANIATTIFVPGKMIDGIKAAANLHKFGLPYTPPAFANTMGDAAIPVQGLTVADVRNTTGVKSWLYVITNERQLVISGMRLPQEVMRNGQFGSFLDKSIHHHDLARNLPIYNGGEFLTNNGILQKISNSSGHYLPEGAHLGTLTEKLFRQHGFNEARNVHQAINVFDFLNKQTPNIIVPPNPGIRPVLGNAAGVLGLIAEGLKTDQAEQAKRQEQRAQDKIVQEQRQQRAANLHADRIAHQQVLNNTRWYNLPYNFLTPRASYWNLAWNAEQQAITEFRLRYGSCPSWVERQISSCSYSMHSMYTSSFNNYPFYSGLSDFSLVLMCTNLINSYNSYNYGSSMYTSWANYGLPGGVATEVSIIQDLVNSKAHALAEAYYICFPTSQFSFPDKLVQQIQRELAEASKEKTLPFFSLHFNQNGFLYPVMHPAYENTLIGRIIGFLDYWMKGYLNGGIFDEAFLKLWHETENCDEQYLRSKMIDLKKYCKEKKPGPGYLSLRELQSRYGVKDASSQSPYQQPFMTAFRIIAYQEKMESHENIVIAHPRFRVEYSVDMMPDYEQYVNNYRKKHGTLPPEYHKTLQCYELFAEEVREKMPQLPFCQDYFNLLGMINAFCYVYSTLEKMGKEPKVAAADKQLSYAFPKSLPPIPVRYYRDFALPLNMKDMVSALRVSEEATVALDKALLALFSTRGKTQFPESVKKQLKTIIKDKVLAVIAPVVTPQDLAELNEVAIEKVLSQTLRGITDIATLQNRTLHRQCLKLLDQFHWLSKEQKRAIPMLPLIEKIQTLKAAQENHCQALKQRWEQTPDLAKAEIFTVFSENEKAYLEQIFKQDEDNIWTQVHAICGQTLTEQQKQTANQAIAQSAQERCIEILTKMAEGWSKDLEKWLTAITHFSDVFIEIEKIADYAVSETYTHSLVSFTGKDLTAKTGDNFQIIGGCGMSLPNLQSQPLPHADAFSKVLVKAFEDSDQDRVSFKHNHQDYFACRLSVSDKNSTPKPVELKQALSFGMLRAVYEKLAPATALAALKDHIIDNKGTTVSHYAAACLPTDLLREAISPESLLIADNYGNLPIHKAAEAGNVANVERLLTIQPEGLEAKNHRAVTPLMLAVQNGHLEVVQLLSAKGANFNACLPNGLFPLYMALLKNFNPLVLWMLENVTSLNVNLQLDSKMSALHLAMEAKDERLVMALLEKGALSNLPRKSDGYCAWHLAAKQGNLAILTAMAAKGAAVDLALESGKTALHLAAEAGSLQAVKFLIASAANVNACTLDKESPLMLAIAAGMEETATFLAGLTLINQLNAQNQNASMLALQYCLPVVTDILLQRGEDIQARDKQEKSVLYYLVKNGEYSRVKKLIQQGIPLDGLYAGQSLLAIAAQYGQFLLVYALQDYGVDFITDTGFTLFDYAVMANEIEFLRESAGYPKIPAALLAIKSEACDSLSYLMKKMDKQDYLQIGNLLAAAIASNHETMTSLLIKHCQNINQRIDKEGNTLLHLLVKNGAHQLLSLLTERNADFTLRNAKNQTVFHLAVLQKDTDFLKRLFKQSQPQDWPLDLWQMETKQSARMVQLLTKYKQRLPENSKQPPLKRSNQNPATRAVRLMEAPVLSGEAHQALKDLEDCLIDACYEDACQLLADYPVLFDVLQSEKGGPLLQLLFENMHELSAIDARVLDGESDNALSFLDKLLTLLVSRKINPANYSGNQNILYTIIKARNDKLAAFQFEMLEKYFSQALSTLANDKIHAEKSAAELSLILGKEALFEKLDSLCQKQESEAWTGLHSAVRAGNTDLVQRLLRRYPVDIKNQKGQTALMLAASMGNIPMMQLLLKFGATLDSTDLYNRNVLHYALDRSASLETALMLIPLLKKPNRADRFGLTPLMKAAARGYVAIMRLLVETRHNINAVDQQGLNALHQAVIADQVASIGFLIERGFAVDEPESPVLESKIAKSRRRTPLHLAAVNAKENALFELLKQGADPEKADRRGFTLCEHGILSQDKAMQNQMRRLPFYYKPERDVFLLEAAVMKDQVVIVAELILRQVNVNAMNSAGQTALHIAALCDAGHSANLLLEGQNMILNVLDLQGFSPIHYAAKLGHVQIVNLLYENNADLNQKTETGESALMLACLSGKEGAVAALLQAGADYTQTNAEGLTASQIALINRQLSIVHLFEQVGDSSLNASTFVHLPQKSGMSLKNALPQAKAYSGRVTPNPLMFFYPPVNSQNPRETSDKQSLSVNQI